MSNTRHLPGESRTMNKVVHKRGVGCIPFSQIKRRSNPDGSNWTWCGRTRKQLIDINEDEQIQWVSAHEDRVTCTACLLLSLDKHE